METYLGLMSGTSLDGVDVATVAFAGEGERPARAELLSFHSFPYEDEFRGRLEEACRAAGPGELCDLNFALGRRLARAARRALEADGREPAEVAAVGSHGQTIWHAPSDGEEPGGARGSTLQMGEAAVVAEETGIPVVADFRVRDVAAGGQGAPLTPYFDRLFFSDPERGRGIQNLGGMGNLTALPPGEGSGEAVAFDTGPGVAMLDAAARRLSGGSERMDRDGRRAAQGDVLEGALEELIADPFFDRPPPRSTGRERFGADRVERWLERHGEAAPEDLLATLTELTARSVARALEVPGFRVEELYLCGGGARNPELARRIEARVAPVRAAPLSELGWDGDAREAAAFALLARQHLLGLPASPPWATGATGPRVLGKLTPAGARR